MNVLVACEFSGTVRDAFAKRGHFAWSCDLLPTESPGNHFQGNVLSPKVMNMDWDLMIAHPPCTYLCSSGLHWNKRIEGRQAKTEEALAFVTALLNADIPHIALENPIGCISKQIRKPDQIIQPWQFGHDASKGTCLWLKNLPPLKPINTLQPSQYGCRCGCRFDYALGKYGCPSCVGDSGAARIVWGNQTPSGQNKLGPSATRWAERSKTYQGIADAMAQQWSDV